jgi:Nucleotidyl transferase AbiEii toxin, Type IV TA system
MHIGGLHRRVAEIALETAAPYGFALGGGNALIAHGLIDRLTQDVDVFTNEEHGVESAASAVESALRAAGFAAERQDMTADLLDIFEGMGQGLPNGDSPVLAASRQSSSSRTSNVRIRPSCWTWVWS